MTWKISACMLVLMPAILAGAGVAQSAPAASSESPLTVTVLDRVRTDASQWYNAPPYTTTYPYVEQLLRFSIAQRIKRFDWQLEGSQNSVFDVPTTSVSPVTAQGQLGLGGTYYAANSSNTLPVAASFRQGFLRYHGAQPDETFRLGRFEFFDGQEMQPANSNIAWLQTN